MPGLSLRELYLWGGGKLAKENPYTYFPSPVYASALERSSNFFLGEIFSRIFSQSKSSLSNVEHNFAIISMQLISINLDYLCLSVPLIRI
jgi:hypothetical protein